MINDFSILEKDIFRIILQIIKKSEGDWLDSTA